MVQEPASTRPGPLHPRRDLEGLQKPVSSTPRLQSGSRVAEPTATNPGSFIDTDGRITARWDNVATVGEIEPLLEALLPKIDS